MKWFINPFLPFSNDYTCYDFLCKTFTCGGNTCSQEVYLANGRCTGMPGSFQDCPGQGPCNMAFLCPLKGD